MEEIHGIPEGAFGGDLEAHAAFIHPEDRERVLAALIRAARDREPHALEYRVVRPDGEVRWLEARAEVLAGRNGRPERVAGVCMDVTARHRSEERVAEAAAEAERARRELHDVLAQSPAAITVTRGPDHFVESQNVLAREQAGVDLVGRTMREALPGIGADDFVALYDEVYRSGQPYMGREIEVRWTDAGGRQRRADINLVIQPLFATDGSVRGLLSHSLDVTEMVNAQRDVEAKAEEMARLAAALQQSNRELDQFAYVASHDLKAPLRGIANLSQWLEEDLGSSLDSRNRTHLQLLRSRVHRMESLIDGLLEYSRAGRARSVKSAVDLQAIVSEVVELVTPDRPERVKTQAPLPRVVAERAPLQQTVLNLVANALKHGGASVTVRVAAMVEDRALHLVVSDDGPGIPPEYHDRIWGLFQTLRARDEVEGAGIGLSVVKKHAESRGGRAWVESSPGAGAAFHVLWPLDGGEEQVAR
jgi:signal transduction histidine kinase